MTLLSLATNLTKSCGRINLIVLRQTLFNFFIFFPSHILWIPAWMNCIYSMSSKILFLVCHVNFLDIRILQCTKGKYFSFSLALLSIQWAWMYYVNSRDNRGSLQGPAALSRVSIRFKKVSCKHVLILQLCFILF